MRKPPLLHALSLHDRILEPHDLPLQGRVWAYAKEECSRDTFIGHCVTVLSQLGMRASGISLKEDIVAFDATCERGTYTVVISLSDDSLASRFYYFMGLWRRPERTPERFDTARFTLDFEAADELLRPAFHYELVFADAPLQLSECARLLDAEPLAQNLYGEGYLLCSNGRFVDGDAADAGTLRFVAAPREMRPAFARGDVRHLLYSVRNLTALTAAAVGTYRELWREEEELSLYRRLLLLLERARDEAPDAGGWDALVRDNGDVLLRGAERSGRIARLRERLDGHERLFHSIVGELEGADIAGVAPLWPRMRLPFEHLGALLGERAGALGRVERQAEILLQLLHSRMLAQQQSRLEALLGEGE